MQRIKNKFFYLLGGILSFVYESKYIQAQFEYPHGDYGISPNKMLPFTKAEPTFWDKLLSIILSPIFLCIIIIISISLGTFIFNKKRKNVKKNIKARKTKTVDNS